MCLEQFKEPKVLPCLHTFCKTCLEGVLVEGKDGTWTIPCPSCRKVVEVHYVSVLCICADHLGLQDRGLDLKAPPKFQTLKYMMSYTI